MTWDPQQYLRFDDERSRPFFELIARVPPLATGANSRPLVVDLGCGAGNLTAALGDRWPDAEILGVDNDPNMLAAAAANASDRVRFEDGDVATWTSPRQADLIVSNATLQWVPGHRELLAHLLKQLRPGGCLAFQVPGNLDDPHHVAIRNLRATTPWAGLASLSDLPHVTHRSHTADEYLDTLAPLCATVDAWDTTYLHVLQGPDPVLEWVKGTALRPILGRLEPEQSAAFCTELAPLLQAAYPSRSWGTPFPFRRVFVVART
jgi:trans-aconitate 2-methyltransferase